MKKTIPTTSTDMENDGYVYVTEVGSWNHVGVAWQIWSRRDEVVIYDPYTQTILGHVTQEIIDCYEDFT